VQVPRIDASDLSTRGKGGEGLHTQQGRRQKRVTLLRLHPNRHPNQLPPNHSQLRCVLA
jgi:hypothetical protein